MKEVIKNSNKNLLIAGDILKGKTTKVIWPIFEEIIKNKESFLVLDTKEEYLNQYYDKLNDYNIVIINLNDLSKSEGLNILERPYELYQNGQTDKAFRYIEGYTSLMFANEKNDYFDLAAADAVTGAILGLFKDAKKEEINFLSLKAIFNGINYKMGTGTALNVYFNRNDNKLAKIYAEATTEASTETRASILSLINQKLRPFISDEKLNSLLSKTTFNLDRETPQAIFLIGNNEGRYNLISQLIIKYLYMYLTDLQFAKFNFILDNVDVLDNNLSLDKMLGIYPNYKFIMATRSKISFENKFGEYIKHLCDVIDIDSENHVFLNGEGIDRFTEESVELKQSNIIYPTLSNELIKVFDAKRFTEEINEKRVQQLIETGLSKNDTTKEETGIDVENMINKIDARIEELEKQETNQNDVK